MVERKGRLWSEKNTVEQKCSSPMQTVLPPTPVANADLLRGFSPIPDGTSNDVNKPESTPSTSVKNIDFSPSPKQQEAVSINTNETNASAHQQPPINLKYRGAPPPELTLSPHSRDDEDHNVINTSHDSSSSSGDGPVSPLEEGNVYFMGDEVGELALGLGEEGEFFDAVWSFDQDDDVQELLDRNHRRNKNDIRRTISKSITPRNGTSMISPRGFDEELQVAIDWNEQQQVHRRESFQRNSTASSTNKATTKATNSKVETMPIDTAEMSPASSRQVWRRNDFNDNGVTASPISTGLTVITGAWKEDLVDDDHEYPDTPSRSEYSKGAFEYLDLPDMNAATTPKSSKHKRPPESENEYEVKTSLPEPDSSWYKNFFGNTAARQVDTFSTAPRNSSKPIMSRFGFYSSSSDKSAGHRKVASVDQVLSDEELLAFAGYKDYGNGLAEC